MRAPRFRGIVFALFLPLLSHVHGQLQSFPAPPAADWATLALFDCNSLPLGDRSAAGSEIQTSALNSVDGRFGSAIDFSEGGVASFTLHLAAQPQHGLTLECWVKLLHQSDERLQRIVGRSGNLGFYTSGNSTRLTFFVAADEWKSLRATLPLNEWCHIAGTFDGHTMRLYINGEVVDEAENPGTLRTSAAPFFFGTEAGRSANRFPGLIDEVRLSKIARTEFMTGSPLPRPEATVTLQTGKVEDDVFRRSMPVPKVVTPPVLDGNLDDPQWQSAPANGFVRLQTGDAPDIPTSVRVIFDDSALYLGYTCLEKGQESFLPGPSSRDNMALFRADAVEAMLQPEVPGAGYVQLAMNPLGGLFDARYEQPGAQEHWDGQGITVHGKISADLWTLEVRIPFASLDRPTPSAGDTWRANFCRNELPSGELSAWAPTAGGFHLPEAFGLLQFVTAPAENGANREAERTIKTCTLAGSVIDGAGNPVVGIPVQTIHGTTRTDIFGEFRLAGLPPGTTPLQIRSPRYLPISGTLNLKNRAEQLAPLTVTRIDPYRYAFAPLDGNPVVWFRSSLTEPPDLSRPLSDNDRASDLQILATPGEYESRAVGILANASLVSPRADIVALRGPENTIPPAAIDVRWTQRLLKRVQYKRTREDAVFSWRYLWREPPAEILKGQVRHLVVTIHVPEDMPPGTYRGNLVLSSEGQASSSLPLSLRVADFTLDKPGKRVGCYYGIRGTPTEQMRRELDDIREHGGDLLIWHAGIWYAKEDDGTIVYNTDAVREAVTLQREHGIGPPYLVGTNPLRAAALAGLKVEMTAAFADAVKQSAEFRQIYAEGIRHLENLQKELGAGEFLFTWMDEVFGHGRFEPWRAFSEITRDLTPTRIYITFHNRNQSQVDAAAPHVDVRCYHGHTLDWWLGQGHAWEELAEELNSDGDEAWTYYNIRDIGVTSEWVRLCNGYWLWRSPLQAHVPWKYYSFGGSPFDDLDSDRHDFAYAAPHPIKPEMVSTLEWECFREGFDDLRYITTLENAIAKAPKHPRAQAARDLLASWRQTDPRVPQTAERLTADNYTERRAQLAQLIEGLQR